MRPKIKTDLRLNEYKEAILSVGRAMEETPLTDRALALLIADSCPAVTMTQALAVLETIPKLRNKYLKKEGK